MAIIVANSENFENEVLKSEKPVVVEFWAPWCGYCKRISPLLKSIAEKNEGIFDIYTVNVDDNEKLQVYYTVLTIPCLFVFKNGKPSDPLIAPESKTVIDEWLKDNGVI